MTLDCDAPRFVGATELRTIAPGSPDYRRWIDICSDAYPRMGLTTAAQRDELFADQLDAAERWPEQRLVGAYREGLLAGGMRVYDFTMCVRSAAVATAGVGSVATALEHKRRGVARDLIGGFLGESRQRGAALALLYPFRPDFYVNLGFGYGAKLNQYRIALDVLPRAGLRERVRRLEPSDVDAFLGTYNRVQARTNGLIAREPWRAAQRLANGTLQTFGFFEDGGLRGYLTFEVQLSDARRSNRDELFVHELVYEDAQALDALFSFVGAQRDQFATVIVNTTEPDFHFAVADPRNGSNRNLYPPVYHETNAQGVGIMYRAIALPVLIDALAGVCFGDLDAVVRVDVCDAFFAANAGACTIRFHGGRPTVADAATAPDVDLAIGVGDWSALLMGSVRLRSLVRYGRAVLLRPEWLRRLDAAFDADPPQCLTRF